MTAAPYSPRQSEHPVHALALVLALFEVRGVEQCLAAVVLQTCFEHLRLGGVEDERQRRLGGEPARDLIHVERAVAADVVDTHIEDVRPFLHLLARHLHATVEVAFEHRVAELPGAVRVGAFADREVCKLLFERHVRVDRGATRLELGRAQHRGAVIEALDDGSQVRGRGAATTSDDVEAELRRKPFVCVREQGRCEVVMRVTVDDARQSRVREGRQERARVLGEVAQVLGHLGGTGCTVHADDVGTHRFEGGQRRADLGADEHAPRRLHRDLHHDRDRIRQPGASHRGPGSVDRGLGLEEVVHGLDQQHVDAAGDEAVDLQAVVVAQRRVLDLTERREPGARSDRTDDEAGPAVGGVTGGDFPGELRGLAVELEGPIGEAVLVQDQREGAEGGRLHTVDAGREELVVHLGDEIGAGRDELLVASFQRFAAEIIGPEVVPLHPRPECTVEDEDTLVERVEERVHGPAADRRGGSSGVGHRTRLRGRMTAPLHDSPGPAP